MPKAHIHTAIQDAKYAANVRTRQPISQSATGTTISDDVNSSLIVNQGVSCNVTQVTVANYRPAPP